MEIYSNGALSDKNLKKRSFENGNCSPASGVPVEYKRRKVSAVRSYPPGCGRTALRITLSYHETRPSRAENCVEEWNDLEVKATVKGEFHERNQGLVKEELSEGEVKGLVKEEVTNGEVKGLVKKEKNDGEIESWVKEESNEEKLSLQGLMKEASHEEEVQVQATEKTVGAVVNKTPYINDANILERTGSKSGHPLRRVLATRNFPLFCGRNAPRPTEEDRWRINGHKRVVSMAKVGVGSGVLRETFGAGPAESKVNAGDGYVHKSKSKSIVFEPRKRLQIKIKRNNKNVTSPARNSMKEKLNSAGNVGLKDDDEENKEDFPLGQDPCDFDVSLPPFGPKNSNHGDARNKVRESLRLFHAICRKLLQGEEAKSRQGEIGRTRKNGKDKDIRRIDLLAAKIVKQKGKEVNTGEQIVGSVPGVEVGDEYLYRVELAIIAVHRLYQGGIDYKKVGKQIVAVSIVASGGYDDELDNNGILVYSGQGGNLVGRNKQPEDQKLERGNLALKNSILAQNPVRVIRGSKETKAADSSDARAKVVMTYVYDGLYLVEKYWQEIGPHGKLVYKFELRRIPGQRELAWKEVKKSNKFKTREGLCVVDISGGKELFPICAVNTIDKQTPQPFKYITKMIYPNRYFPTPPKGCDCIGGCVDSRRCSCATKNGGYFPYNYNGAIVETKALVYECGPSCKCPPSCYNRVSQHGTQIQLEIFKTELRGWGVRSLNSIPSGSFICEYTGELLEDMEAEQRTNDEYLFDIGQNYNDCSVKPDIEPMDYGAFTIDAVKCGNVGRFINHSCSPNLYAQNVLYDHEDKRMPHIMLFAAENIPPLVELNYHYHYSVDQIYDSDGNIKVKRCYCGSNACSGRMY
ncbi:hypothetical protein LguiB_028641 [Lonicera macranthoides]